MLFRTRLFIAVIPVVLASILAIGGLLILQVQAGTLGQEDRILALLAENLETDFRARMASLQELQLQDNPFYVDRVMADLDRKFSKSLAHVLIIDRKGQVLVPRGYTHPTLGPDSRLGLFLKGLPPGETRPFRVSDAFFPVASHEYIGVIRNQGPFEMVLVCYEDLDQVYGPVTRAIQSTLILGSLVLLVVVIGLYRLAGRIARPLLSLSRGVRAFAAGQLEGRLSLPYSREFIALGTDFNHMADRIRNFTEELEKKVEDRTRDLAATRDRLVQMEKMAALGALVSGFAHELNTPLGNALTAVSLAEVLTAPDRGPQDPSVSESLGSAHRSLDRAIQMMSRFREVSADQREAVVRAVLLDGYFRERIEPLLGLRGRRRLSGKFICPEGLVVRTKPAVLDQIFEELIDNTLFHGYPDQTGDFQVEVVRSGPNLVVTVGDTGLGIPPGLESTAFDPFVTSRRHEGRVGLGLHIVFNLVTRQLGGQIRLLDRKPGAWFQLTFPEPGDQEPISSR